jgi:hypothetical protein
MVVRGPNPLEGVTSIVLCEMIREDIGGNRIRVAGDGFLGGRAWNERYSNGNPRTSLGSGRHPLSAPVTSRDISPCETYIRWHTTFLNFWGKWRGRIKVFKVKLE